MYFNHSFNMSVTVFQVLRRYDTICQSVYFKCCSVITRYVSECISSVAALWHVSEWHISECISSVAALWHDMSVAVFQVLQCYDMSVSVFCLVPSICGIQHIQRASNEVGNRLNLFDSVYFVIVTFSTVGYGDISPDIWPAQVFMLLMICIAFAFIPMQVRPVKTYMGNMTGDCCITIV